MEYTKDCKYCENEFVTNSKNKVYCSSDCRFDWNHRPTKCNMCDNEIRVSRKKFENGGPHHCVPCNGKIRTMKATMTISCDTCNIKFERLSNRVKEYNYCSPRCAHKSQESKMTKECSNCRNPVTRKKSDFLSVKYSGKKRDNVYCSIDCMGEHYRDSGMFSGTNSGTWNGGKEEYKGPDWEKQRALSRKRDSYSCVRCGVKEDELGMELSVHHIIPFSLWNNSWEANDLSNLKTLCEPCHRKEHSGDNHHSKFNETYKDFIAEQQSKK